MAGRAHDAVLEQLRHAVRERDVRVLDVRRADERGDELEQRHLLGVVRVRRVARAAARVRARRALRGRRRARPRDGEALA